MRNKYFKRITTNEGRMEEKKEKMIGQEVNQLKVF